MVGAPETLADLLASGPLSLEAVLRFASEIATELRALDLEKRTYGQLTASNIILTESGAHLLPLRNCWDEALPEGDVQAFGALFREMLTRMEPPVTLVEDIGVPRPRTGPAGLGPAAMKLALACLEPKSSGLSIQQLTSQIRLLDVLLRQYEANRRLAQESAPAPTPHLVRAEQPVAAPTADSAAATPPVDAGAEQNPTGGDTGAAPMVRPRWRDNFGHPEANTKPELQRVGGICSRCHNCEVYVSSAYSRFERMLRRCRVPIYRCHCCDYRYVNLAGLKVYKK